ncbi:hypothetical protein C8E87_3366 [Paractinoplanes brasiliensis]|uniref:Uncharacterized protein n=1 Tax=Paractinoplanes brasiliensis TaxID=52695 RepID=A0A4R6JSS9_9ACTN|nr:hypothetical protein C8E87_3366 [Actinoplanes brasiliensis]
MVGGGAVPGCGRSFTSNVIRVVAEGGPVGDLLVTFDGCGVAVGCGQLPQEQQLFPVGLVAGCRLFAPESRFRSLGRRPVTMFGGSQPLLCDLLCLVAGLVADRRRLITGFGILIAIVRRRVTGISGIIACLPGPVSIVRAVHAVTGPHSPILSPKGSSVTHEVLAEHRLPLPISSVKACWRCLA